MCDYNCKENKLDCLPFEKHHNKVFKMTLGVHKMSRNFACRWELGRSYIFDYILLQSFEYYDRLIHLPSSRLLYKVFMTHKELHESRAKSWFTFIEKYASKYNLSLNDFDIKAHQQDMKIKMLTRFYLKWININQQITISFVSFQTLQKILVFKNIWIWACLKIKPNTLQSFE